MARGCCEEIEGKRECGRGGGGGGVAVLFGELGEWKGEGRREVLSRVLFAVWCCLLHGSAFGIEVGGDRSFVADGCWRLVAVAGAEARVDDGFVGG